MNFRINSLLAAIALSCPPAFAADAWDPLDDKASGAPHDLAHGSDETHELAARVSGTTLIADVDWFLMPEEPYASYEVAIDGIANEAGSPGLALYDETGVLLRATSLPQSTAGGSSRAVRWISDASQPRLNAIRVGDAACVRCSTNARYRIRAVDTTLTIARVNNSGGMVTVLRLANPRTPFCNARVNFWSAAGNFLGGTSFQVPARGSISYNTAGVPQINGSSGSITIAHDCGYGGLTAQTEIIEVSATGTAVRIHDATMRPR